MSENLIYKKMASIMKKVGHVGKDRKNQQQGYSFRGIDDMYNALHKHFADEGVFITTEVLKITREERVNKSGGNLIYTVIEAKVSCHAEDGSCISSVTVGEGMDSSDKSCNKAMSAALKYVLMQMLLIPTAEPKDPENDNLEPNPKNNAVAPTATTTPASTKPLISEKQFLAIKDRIKNGDFNAYAGALATFNLTQDQSMVLTKLRDDARQALKQTA